VGGEKVVGIGRLRVLRKFPRKEKQRLFWKWEKPWEGRDAVGKRKGKDAKWDNDKRGGEGEKSGKTGKSHDKK